MRWNWFSLNHSGLVSAALAERTSLNVRESTATFNKRVSQTGSAIETTGQARLGKRRRQRTAALQDASRVSKAQRVPPGFGVRLPSAAFPLIPKATPSPKSYA